MTDQELKQIEIYAGQKSVADYDAERKKEGYSITYRRRVRYMDIGTSSGQYGEHIETRYLHPSGKSLLLKTMPDGERLVCYEGLWTEQHDM